MPLLPPPPEPIPRGRTRNRSAQTIVDRTTRDKQGGGLDCKPQAGVLWPFSGVQGQSPWALFASFLPRQKGGPPEGQTPLSHQPQPAPRAATQRWDAKRATIYKMAVRFQSGAEPRTTAEGRRVRGRLAAGVVASHGSFPRGRRPKGEQRNRNLSPFFPLDRLV